MVTIRTIGFNTRNCTLSTHGGFMCFIGVPARTANISLYRNGFSNRWSVYCAVRTEYLSILQVRLIFILLRAVPRVRRLVVSLSPRRHGFDSRSVHVRFVVSRVAPGQVVLWVLRFSPVSILICASRATGQTDKAWKPSRNRCCFGNRRSMDRKEPSLFYPIRRKFYQYSSVESFVFVMLVEHDDVKVVLTSGPFHNDFPWKSSFISCSHMRAKHVAYLTLIFLVLRNARWDVFKCSYLCLSAFSFRVRSYCQLPISWKK